MKRILATLICLELFLAPITPHLKFFGIQESWAESCQAGFEYNSSLGRCLTSEQTAQIMQATSQCDASDVNCYRSNAENVLGKAENDGTLKTGDKLFNGGGLGKEAMDAMAVSLPLILSVQALKGTPTKCQAYSAYAMIAGAASLFVGDLVSTLQHKSRLKKIKKQWNDIIKPGSDSETNADQKKVNATYAQSEAFEMLAKSEDSMASAAKMKATFNAIAMAAFATSGIIATMESIESSTNPASAARNICASKPAKEDKPTPEVSDATSAEKKPNVQTKEPEAAKTQAYEDTRIKPGEVQQLPEATQSPQPTQAVTEPSAPAPNNTQPVDPFEGQVKSTDISKLKKPTVKKIPAKKLPVKKLPSIKKVPSGGGGKVPIKGINFNQPLNTYNFEMKKKHFDNVIQAKDFASFIVLNNHFQNLDYQNSSPSIEEYDKYVRYFKNSGVDQLPEVLAIVKAISMKFINEANPIPSAYADGKEIVKTVAKTAVFGVIAVQIASYITTPMRRAVLSGTLALWSGIMYKHASNQASISKDRASYLRKMKSDFQNASDGINMCKPEDRNDSTKPECYCYTADGHHNPNRSNSQICLNLFASAKGSSQSYFANGEGKITSCIASSGSIDNLCQCKKNNSCMKVSLNGLSGVSTGTFSMLSSMLAPNNQIASGSFDAAKVDSAALASNAARVMASTQKLVEQKNPGLKLEKDKLEKKLQNEMMGATQGMSAPNTLSNSSSLQNLSPKQAIAELEKELKKSEGAEVTTASSGETVTTPDNKPEEQLEFGLTQEDLAKQENEVAEVMKENLDYGQNDINNSSSTNLFEVLSNRYQRSGMRRLFDETGKAQGDKPAETDINK